MKSYSIAEFVKYINVSRNKSDDIHITKYHEHPNLRLQSDAITTNFYLIALKYDFENYEVFGQTNYDTGSAFAYFDLPHQPIEWSVKRPWSGYHILIHEALFKRFAKDYNFLNYKNHESLFVTEEEEQLLIDLFKKAYDEYYKAHFSIEILLSYAQLILSYINTFYQRQFKTRSKKYNKVVSDFYKNLEAYFDDSKDVFELPSVSYFASKSNLSSNYFGDVIKHFTGNSPAEHIQEHLLLVAKNKLRQPDLSISQIAYSLGFDYPTYFTRFFKKKTGVTPTVFRKQ
ncbi:helix-turn-helix domain-containing protein [Winogradskyella sp.]|uniref:helix-turn-helix domain-containing protein n=1 Tax=Winogradskyella sp. TaxID=1883156 RepID=UPI003BA85561